MREKNRDGMEFNDKIDEIITAAFEIREEPSVWLNQKIVRKAKGDNNMRRPFFKTVPVIAALAAGILGVGSITTYAAWKYLSAEQVAEETADKKLANAFKEEDKIDIKQSQTYGNYKITLLGLVSGKNLSDYVSSYNGELQDDKSYAAVVIEKKDGSAITEKENIADSFFISPYIKGENPIHCNIYYMGGAMTTFIQDGMMYQIADCDNIEVFAKRGVYLGVSSGTFYNKNAYNFDKETGEIRRNEKYDGVNALFDLPLDELKGDEAAAKEQLAKWKDNAEAEETEFSMEKEGGEELEDSDASITKKVMIGCSDDGELPDIDLRNETAKWDVKRIKKEAELVKGSVKKLKPDKNGEIKYKYKGDIDIVNVNDSFNTKEDLKNGINNGASLKDDGYIYFTVMEKEDDGTVTCSTYRVKPGK